MQSQAVQQLIGVVGGVGPYSGLDLVKKIFDQTKASTDQEHLPVALLSVPAAIEDRTEYLLEKSTENPGYAIARVMLELEKLGAIVAAVPCNTAHALPIFELVKQKVQATGSKLKILHMIEETARFLKKEYTGLSKIGVLSTTGTYRYKLYNRLLADSGFTLMLPTEEMQQTLVHPAIYHPEYGIKTQSNPVHRQARKNLLIAIESLVSAGAEAIILGCTELPLALPEPVLHGAVLIDPTLVLARALIRETNPDKLKPYTHV